MLASLTSILVLVVIGLAALGGLASKLGLATGPLAAALLIGDAQYARVIVLSVIALCACCALVVAPAARLDRAA